MCTCICWESPDCMWCYASEEAQRSHPTRSQNLRRKKSVYRLILLIFFFNLNSKQHIYFWLICSISIVCLRSRDASNLHNSKSSIFNAHVWNNNCFQILQFLYYPTLFMIIASVVSPFLENVLISMRRLNEELYMFSTFMLWSTHLEIMLSKIFTWILFF